jgi:hypothetical protein
LCGLFALKHKHLFYFKGVRGKGRAVKALDLNFATDITSLLFRNENHLVRPLLSLNCFLRYETQNYQRKPLLNEIHVGVLFSYLKAGICILNHLFVDDEVQSAVLSFS